MRVMMHQMNDVISGKRNISGGQIRAVEFLGEYKKIGTKEYCKLFNIARDTANRDLNELLTKAIIERKGSGPQTYYILSNTPIGQYRTVSGNKI